MADIHHLHLSGPNWACGTRDGQATGELRLVNCPACLAAHEALEAAQVAKRYVKPADAKGGEIAKIAELETELAALKEHEHGHEEVLSVPSAVLHGDSEHGPVHVGDPNVPNVQAVGDGHEVRAHD